MKIIHIIDSLGIGGAERLITDIVPNLVEKGNKVDVVLLNGEKTHLYKELESLNCCKIYSLGKSYYNPLYILKLIPYFYSYDIIHVHLFPAQYFAALARLFCFKKVKLIFTEHNTSNTRLESKKYRWIERFIYSCYNKVVCITNEVKTVLIDRLNLNESKLIVVENGVSLETVRSADLISRESMGFNENDKLLIMVAGFRPQKDHDTVIRSLVKLPSVYKLLLVGDGERRKELENLVSELSLSGRVHFLGIRSDVYSLMKMCDVAILSSHWEGFGLVAVEAMASGIPLIASNVDGLAQVVEGGGILFEKGSESDLYDKILSLEGESYYQEVCEKGLIKAKRYDIDSMVDKLIVVYETV
ncbi:glycosyltransferase [Myroides marinus]|uniref:glycosyltransferase n=1 Tax=Myroides marinus TaxID=703342 RepID=UPI002576BB3F|nr:glycosyltransferase [Myroides marinus]MDM1405487.1 glycosyltransferase [Myroides marinus]